LVLVVGSTFPIIPTTVSDFPQVSRYLQIRLPSFGVRTDLAALLPSLRTLRLIYRQNKVSETFRYHLLSFLIKYFDNAHPRSRFPQSRLEFGHWEPSKVVLLAVAAHDNSLLKRSIGYRSESQVVNLMYVTRCVLSKLK
jgi:hypothetical protein